MALLDALDIYGLRSQLSACDVVGWGVGGRAIGSSSRIALEVWPLARD